MALKHVMINDIIAEHSARMQNLKKYYPFFVLNETTFTQYKEGKYAFLDMGYITMATLRFFINENNFHEKDVTYEEVKAVYDKYYSDEYFVRVLDKDVCPETRWVEGSNFVDIGFKIEPRTHRLIMMGALDNLVKGAAGQAVQNMNILFGLPENEGLQMAPMFP